jgi:hypothetical protein
VNGGGLSLGSGRHGIETERDKPAAARQPVL